MDFKTMTAKEARDIISGRKKIRLTDDEWLEMDAWLDEFLKSDASPEEKEMFVPFGWSEALCMICDGIIRWRNSICMKCKMQQGFDKYLCSVHQENGKHLGGIPNEIWANEDAACPYYEPIDHNN